MKSLIKKYVSAGYILMYYTQLGTIHHKYEDDVRIVKNAAMLEMYLMKAWIAETHKIHVNIYRSLDLDLINLNRKYFYVIQRDEPKFQHSSGYRNKELLTLKLALKDALTVINKK